MEYEEVKKDYVRYRLNTAKQDLKAANLLYENSIYNAAVNRAYYAIFHAMRAVLAIDGVDFKKHSGVISYFNKEYIKKGVFDKRFSKIIQNANISRTGSDYEDFYDVSKQEAKDKCAEAMEFYEEIERYIFKMI